MESTPYAAALEDLAARSLLRRLPEAIDVPGPVVRMGNRELVALNSNNYLGLASHPHVMRGSIEAIQAGGCSATGSRLLSGHLSLHEELERRLAAFKRVPAALLMNAGFAANLGVLGAIAGPGDLIVGDKLNHASLIDGARASGAEVRHAPHGSLSRMAALLEKGANARRRFIVVDGVFSMDGDLADLPALCALAERYEATLVVDEAHATGVLGATGRGSFEHWGLDPGASIQIGTLGKALGGFGAFVLGDPDLISWLVNRARPFVFSTALPPAVLGAALGALDVLEAEPTLVRSLADNAAYLREGLRRLGFEVPDGATPIIPVRVGEAADALRLAEELLVEGVLAQAVRPPTVPPGTARLRITVMATHTREHLDRALEGFARAARVLR